MAIDSRSSSTTGFAKEAWSSRPAWYQKLVLWILHQSIVPCHVVIVPDGNRRSARLNGIPLRSSYIVMCEKIALMCQCLVAVGVKNMSSYVFSKRNFLRDTEEIDAVLGGVDEFSKTTLPSLESLQKMDMSVCVVGELGLLPKELQSNMAKAEVATSAANRKRKCVLCAAYTSRSGLKVVALHMAKVIKCGFLRSEDITSELIRDAMAITEAPDAELWFRSSGRQCLMELMVLQSGYAYMHIEPGLWASVGFSEIIKTILKFQLHWPYIMAIKERHEILHSSQDPMDLEKTIRQRTFLRRMKSWRTADIERFCPSELVSKNQNDV